MKSPDWVIHERMAAHKPHARRASFLHGFLDWLLPSSRAEPHTNTGPRSAPQRMQIVLAGRHIEYDLIRSRRQSIGMFVARRGLTVRAPPRTPLREIQQVLVERSGWIVAQLDEWQRRTALVAGDYRDGGSLLFRGKRVRLRVLPSLFESLEFSGDELVIATPEPLTAKDMQTLIERWLRDVAQETFEPTIRTMADRIGVSVRRVQLTDTKTMWGSCTGDGVVRLTFRLIQLPPSLATYVIAHEISHRREMNHSPQFWAWVRVLDPHYKTHRRTLHAYAPLLEEGA